MTTECDWVRPITYRFEKVDWELEKQLLAHNQKYDELCREEE